MHNKNNNVIGVNWIREVIDIYWISGAVSRQSIGRGRKNREEKGRGERERGKKEENGERGEEKGEEEGVIRYFEGRGSITQACAGSDCSPIVGESTGHTGCRPLPTQHALMSKELVHSCMQSNIVRNNIQRLAVRVYRCIYTGTALFVSRCRPLWCTLPSSLYAWNTEHWLHYTLAAWIAE